MRRSRRRSRHRRRRLPASLVDRATTTTTTPTTTTTTLATPHTTPLARSSTRRLQANWLMKAFATVAIGSLSDRPSIGRRRAILGAFGFYIIGTLGCASVPAARGAGGIYWLIGFRVVQARGPDERSTRRARRVRRRGAPRRTAMALFGRGPPPSFAASRVCDERSSLGGTSVTRSDTTRTVPVSGCAAFGRRTTPRVSLNVTSSSSPSRAARRRGWSVVRRRSARRRRSSRRRSRATYWTTRRR